MIEGLDISVIIPTYNRVEALERTLQVLGQQMFPLDRFEVIVVDDGSTDGACERSLSRDLPYRFHLLCQQNRGAAAARNLGASRAAGKIVLFLDADMVAQSDLLARHQAGHRTHLQALVVGRRDPYDESEDDPLVNLLEYGPGRIDPRCAKVPFTFQEVFTCNLSLRVAHWQALGGFDEEFPASGYEDIEFAYRAMLSGLEIVSSPEAIAYHNHPATMRQYCRQAQSYKRSAALLIKKHPELRGQLVSLEDKEPIDVRCDSVGLVIRKIVRRLLALRPVLWTMELALSLFRRVWPAPGLLRFLGWKIVGSYQLIGFREGIEQYGWP